MPKSVLSWLLESQSEHAYFSEALKQAQYAYGSTHPNPSVGAIIEKDGQIVSRAYTQKVGGPHAEKLAIDQASISLEGASLYVTLEPCCHIGRTPPCTEAIINSGIKRVIYGALDPNPIVCGNGIKALTQAGLSVEQLTDQDWLEQSQALIRPFAGYILNQRPYVIVKIASSDDLKISRMGMRTKITGLDADIVVHNMRRALDAVMVGANTFRIDKPKLTARLGDLRHGGQPVRVVLGSEQSFTGDLWQVSGRPKILAALELLAERGITSVLVEPGARLFKSLMEENLADEIWWFRSKQTIGPTGLGLAYTPTDLSKLGFAFSQEKTLGEDILCIWLKS